VVHMARASDRASSKVQVRTMDKARVWLVLGQELGLGLGLQVG
jgi:hypothetical protein